MSAEASRGPHHSPGADGFGVPPNMFGPVPETHYAVVGRIVMISALLEENLHDVFCAVARAPQEEQAGDAGTGLIKKITRHLDQFPTEHQDFVAQFLRDTGEVLELRHEVVHSVWPHSATSGGLGWRSVPGHKRRAEGDIRAWTQLRSDELPDVVRMLVDLQRQCREIAAWA